MNPRNGTSDPTKLTFRAGDPPRVITLAYPQGKLFASKFPGGGDQLMFSTVDGFRFFTDPYLQTRLDQAGITANVPFSLQLVESVNGNRRTVEYVVRKIGAGAPVNEPAPVRSGGTVTPNPTPPARAMSDDEARRFMPPPPPQGPVNGAGETCRDIMSRCTRDAVDLALETMAYAKEKGLGIGSPTFEDLRACATAMFISGTKNGCAR